MLIRWNSSCRIFKIHNSGRREKERVHLLYAIFVTAPVFHLDTSWLNADALRNTAREGATKKRKDQSTTNNNKKGPVSNTQNQKNRTCENCDPMKLELSYLQNAQQRKAWPQRGRKSTLTAIHSCHRPRIPVGHVLIERRCVTKHCKRGCNKEKERPSHHKQQKRGTVS